MKTNCPECGTSFDVPAPEEGMAVECPSCGLRLRIVTIGPTKIYFETETSEGTEDFSGEG